jgi:hypothetical protein
MFRPGVAGGPVDGSSAAGRVAILDNARYVATDAYPFRLNSPTWGWIDLIGGLLVAGAGWAVFWGRTWGRIVGISPAPPPTTRP